MEFNVNCGKSGLYFLVMVFIVMFFCEFNYLFGVLFNKISDCCCVVIFCDILYIEVDFLYFFNNCVGNYFVGE